MSDPEICEKGGSGLLLPLFGDDEQDWPKNARQIMYAVCLSWCFLGVSIIADIFMAGIEAVTSKRKTRILDNGQTVTLKVWNPTVANLTLMALGSSAPEILLNVIEILQNEFFAGPLGPSTIVGSAAFNLLMIIAICIYCIPSGDARTIRTLEVFMVTAFFSVFAYLWLIFVLGIFTPDMVDLTEGILTFVFFPILVVLAYMADIGMFSKRSTKEGKKKENEDKANADAEAGSSSWTTIGNVWGAVWGFKEAAEEAKADATSQPKQTVQDASAAEQEAAAVKIQSIQRGKQSRKDVEAMKGMKLDLAKMKDEKKKENDDKQKAEDEASAAATKADVTSQPEQTVQEASAAKQEAAAVKIQSVQRGKRHNSARKRTYQQGRVTFWPWPCSR